MNVHQSSFSQLSNSASMNSGFSHTHRNDNIGIFVFTVWKQKKIPVTKCYPQVGIEPRPLIAYDSKPNTLLSTLTWHVLLRRSLNFCSWTTWYLDLDDLRGINRAWLYMETKVSVLQANVKLVEFLCLCDKPESCEILAFNYCSNRKMLKFNKEITEAKMLNYLMMNYSCEFLATQ